MADTAVVVKTEEKTLKIPPEVLAQFPDLVALIQGSKSMNFDERQYWIDVLPIMSEDQITNLRGILENEKKQLEESAKAYSNSLTEKEKKPAFDEKAYQDKKREREEAEALHEAEEANAEENILDELDNL